MSKLLKGQDLIQHIRDCPACLEQAITAMAEARGRSARRDLIEMGPGIDPIPLPCGRQVGI